MKPTLILYIFFLLCNCSLNKDSKYWTEEHLNWKEKKIINDINKKRLPKIIKKSDDIRSMTLDEYRIYIDDYTKKNKYPDINQ